MQSHYSLVQRAQALCLQAKAVDNIDDKNAILHGFSTLLGHFIYGEYCYDGYTLGEVQLIQYHLLNYLQAPPHTNPRFHYEQALIEIERLFITLKRQGLIEENDLQSFNT